MKLSFKSEALGAFRPWVNGAGWVGVLLLCSCAATSVKETWKSPEFPGHVTKVAVLAIEERGDIRQGIENRFCAELEKAGAGGIRSHQMLSLSEITQDKQAAAARLRAAGADSILVVRLRDIASFYRETRPGHASYAEYVTGYEPATWDGYYTIAFTDMSPTYANLKQKVYLESGLYDLTTARRLWSGLTQTVITDRTDRLDEADATAAKVVAALRHDRMIP